MTDLIRVVKDGKGWRLEDHKGRQHSTRIADKARAERQAAALNATLNRVREGMKPR